jgi:predicted ATP-dependent serine protease
VAVVIAHYKENLDWIKNIKYKNYVIISKEKYEPEQILNKGYDLVLIDSAAEIIEGVRDDNNWDRKMAESWLVDVCIKNNKGENVVEKFTSFLLIQQVTKSGVFAGSNKLKHLVDSFGEMRRESERDGSGTYINFTKNRNGLVDVKMYYELKNSKIKYGQMMMSEEIA